MMYPSRLVKDFEGRVEMPALQSRHKFYLNGIVLISSILNMQTARFDIGNDLPFPLFLPTYTATACYHKKLDAGLLRDLKSTLKEVEAFALGEYNTALMKGSDLSPEEYSNIVDKLSRYTGLSKDYIGQTNLGSIYCQCVFHHAAYPVIIGG